jgi:hypothetical protein
MKKLHTLELRQIWQDIYNKGPEILASDDIDTFNNNSRQLAELGRELNIREGTTVAIIALT